MYECIISANSLNCLCCFVLLFFLSNWVKENRMCRDQRLAAFLAANAASLYPVLHISGMCKDLRRKQKKKRKN